MFKSVEDLQKLGKGQIEAAAASAAAMSRGLQQIAAESSAFAKRSVEDGSAATTRLMGQRSLDGAVQVQTEYAKATFEGLMAQASRMSGLVMSVGRDVAKPYEGAMPFDLGGKASGR